MKDDLKKLKEFKNNLTEENVGEFKILIERIKNQLPENLKIKFSMLEFYEYQQEFSNDNDLPF